MSILSKLMDTMRFSPDEDEDYFGPDEDYEAEKPAKRGRFPAREESENYDDGGEEKPRFFSRSSKVVPMKRSMEVSMVKPTSIEDAREICDYLLAGKAVVLNMEGIRLYFWRYLLHERKPPEDFQLHLYCHTGNCGALR